MRDRVVLLLLTTLFLAGCQMDWFGRSDASHQYGTLVLTPHTNALPSRTILPDLDMDIAYYDVVGEGPQAATFSQSNITSGQVVADSLIAGSWAVTANAYNAGDQHIGIGTVSAEVVPGDITLAEVVIAPLAGAGTLEIALSWPPGALDAPSVSGLLEDQTGTGETVPFIYGTDSASYTFAALDSGYYSLTVQLYDGDELRYGLFEAVRVLHDQTTHAVFSLTSQDIDDF